jgi:hypothetical protein
MAVAEHDPKVVGLAQSEGGVDNPRMYHKPVLILHLVGVGVERDRPSSEENLVGPDPGTSDEYERCGLTWAEAPSMLLEQLEQIRTHTK